MSDTDVSGLERAAEVPTPAEEAEASPPDAPPMPEADGHLEAAQRTNQASSVSESVKRGLSAITGWNLAPQTEAAAKLELGDICESVARLSLRQEEDQSSDLVGEVPTGQPLVLIEVEADQQAVKVRTYAGEEGWTATKAENGDPLLFKRGRAVDLIMDNWDKEGTHQVRSMVTVRAGESLDSDYICELQPGTLLTVKEFGLSNKRRALVDAGSVQGWISILTKRGEYLVCKVAAPDPSAFEPAPVTNKVVIDMTIDWTERVRINCLRDCPCEVRNVRGDSLPMDPKGVLVTVPAHEDFPLEITFAPVEDSGVLDTEPKEDGVSCRICLEVEGGELLAPCLCCGSSRYVHRECLDSWRISGFDPKTVTHCGTCKAKFRLAEPLDAKGAEREVWTEMAWYLSVRIGVFLSIVTLLGFLTPWLFGADEVRLLTNRVLNHFTVGTLSAFVLAGGWAILQALWSLNLCGFHAHGWSLDGKDAMLVVLVIVAIVGAIYLLYQLIRGLYEVAQAGQQVATANIHVRNKEMRKRIVERYPVLNYETGDSCKSKND